MRLGNPKKDALVHKAVFELRYRYGFNYLDRCGRITNGIMREWPEWILADLSPNPQNAPLINTKNNCRFNFSSLRLDFAIEQEMGEECVSVEDLTEYQSQVADLSEFVIADLELTDFARIGFRVWFLFACKNKEEAEEWLGNLDCFAIAANLPRAFKGNLKSASTAVVIESEDRMFRIAFSNVERSVPLNLGSEILNIPSHTLPHKQREHLLAQQKLKKKLIHNPSFAAMIDVDAFQDDPQMVKPGDFVSTSLEQIQRFLTDAIQEGP